MLQFLRMTRVISFSWMNNSGIGTAKANDKAVLVAFFPKTGKATFAFSDATRQQQTAVLELYSQSGIAETWLGFLSADEKNAANSVYACFPERLELKIT